MRVSNTNNYPLFIHPKNKLPDIPTRAKLEEPLPQEFKYGKERVTSNDIKLKNTPGAEEKDDKGKWINKLFEKLDNYLDIVSTVELGDNTKEEAKNILKQSVHIAEETTKWAIYNVKKCGIATKAIALAVPVGIVQSFLNNFDIGKPLLKLTVDFVHDLLLQIRNYKQYKTYHQEKDDWGKNKYEEERYGNKAAGILADLACNTETKIGWLRPILGLISKKAHKVLDPIISLPRFSWFRGRMANEINQRFLTHLLKYIVHKLLSVFGSKRSKEIVREIKEEGYLSFNYIKERNRKNIGIEHDKSISITKQFFKELKLTFTKSTPENEKIKSSTKVSKLLGSFLGLYGFFALIIGTPIKSVLEYFDKKNKYIESFCQSGIAFQHLTYILKFIIPEYCENKIKDYPKENIESEKLRHNKNKLFYIGLSSCLMNVASIFLKLFNIDDKKYLQIARDIYDGLADKGISYYFSRRRELLGREDRLFNPQLYNTDDSPKIISDKRLP